MGGRECFHCRQWIEAGATHDCWTTTEAALTRGLPDDLRDAYERLRETAAGLGEQRIYASHHSIMFSRNACYCFVRPRPTRLEVCIFLGRPLKAPQVRRVDSTSAVKFANIVHVRHRDEVEAPLTDWIREAFEASPTLRAPRSAVRKPSRRKAVPRKKADTRAAASRKRTSKARR